MIKEEMHENLSDSDSQGGIGRKKRGKRKTGGLENNRVSVGSSSASSVFKSSDGGSTYFEAEKSNLPKTNLVLSKSAFEDTFERQNDILKQVMKFDVMPGKGSQ